MLKVHQILVSALGLAALGVGLAGCGQRGPLYLPTEPAAANRATLPDLIRPGSPAPAETAPAATSSAPERAK
ncbi:lipoprotein [Variovorax sp. J22G21]|uniref:LPS translocon maturation chaperone LptM n=1 Tax=Variovorax fucosicus TaxID=3053517 RepID=UPI002578FFDD|nr:MULTISPECIES: lipoprotein [unclassified Variovorax]MDM0038209.1 lipoprotein [Variovorax sp. J22R193]MDM0062985.1 lipoprotein [Variovorax sp. J22G21]